MGFLEDAESDYTSSSDGSRVAALKQVLRGADESDAPPRRGPPSHSAGPTRVQRASRHIAAHLIAAEHFSESRAKQWHRQDHSRISTSDAHPLSGTAGSAIGLPTISADHDRSSKNHDRSLERRRRVVTTSGTSASPSDPSEATGRRPKASRPKSPFFTISRRDNPSQPWRYLAGRPRANTVRGLHGAPG